MENVMNLKNLFYKINAGKESEYDFVKGTVAQSGLFMS
jgi:hypothetical protein